MDIRTLFKEIINIGYNVQEKTYEDGRDIDGRAIWQYIEQQILPIMKKENISIFEQIKSIVLSIIQDNNIDNLKYLENTDFYTDIDSLNITEEFNPKYNHFLLQLKNLVLVKSTDRNIKLNRLFQIAYNLGQLLYNYKNNKLPPEMENIIKKNNNIFTIEKFVDNNTLNKLENKYEKIDINISNIEYKYQNGGSIYYYKYLKYKTKYVKYKTK